MPPTVHRLVDVWLEEVGLAPANLTKTLARAPELRDALSVGSAVVTLRTSAAFRFATGVKAPLQYSGHSSGRISRR